MTSITYADIHSVMNLNATDDISIINTENIIDLAIDHLNLYGADLPNMSGTAGAKTVGLESNEKAAVFNAFRAIYYGFFKGITSASVAGMAVTATDLMSNPAVLRAIKENARQLTEIEVGRG